MKLKKSQIKELIRQAIVEDIMDKEIKNPKTGNMIKLRTALQLPDEHPANKKAKGMVAKSPIGGKSKKKKGFFSKLSKLNPFSKKDDKPKEKPDSLVPDKPSFLGGDTKVGEKAEQTHDRVGEFIDDNEGNIPEEYVDKLKDLQKKAEDIGLSIFNNDGRAPEGTTNKIKELDAEAQEMMDDIEQKAMDGEFDKDKKESVKESKKRRYTVKEVRMWMKKLEENRYKKVYNSDARRVAWMVNNEGVELSEMPKSMSKKWTKAQYGRERYLATEFLKSKSEQMTEGKLTEKVKYKKDKKIGGEWYTKQGTHKHQMKANIIAKREFGRYYDTKVVKEKGGYTIYVKPLKEGKLTSEQKLRQTIREIIKEQLNEDYKNSEWEVYVKDEKGKEKIVKKAKSKRAATILYNKIIKSDDYYEVGMKVVKEGNLTEVKFKKVILPNDMKTKVKVSKMIKQLKLKIDKDYDVKALKARGGDQVISILPKHYNKFIELAMQNKLNPRG